MPKIDYKKEYAELYKQKKGVISVVEVPPLKYSMMDGKGNPNTSQEYQESIEALYALSYALKFMSKKGPDELDYVVMPLEGLWWADDMSDFSVDAKDDWFWTSMIMQPKHITADMFAEAVETVRKKKNPAALDKIRFEEFTEGTAAQILHIGPFADEGPTIEKLHDFIRENGFTFDELKQKHHEIYLSDFRKADPAKLKTIIRQPCTK
ncbi:MAG: hypothetical protein GY771_13130 [bacterium]|nr:hypothetical protein [bacterium]